MIVIDLDEFTTLDNAKAWDQTEDKFLYCLYLLELSLYEDGDDECTKIINRLENRFEKLLEAT